MIHFMWHFKRVSYFPQNAKVIETYARNKKNVDRVHSFNRGEFSTFRVSMVGFLSGVVYVMMTRSFIGKIVFLGLL